MAIKGGDSMEAPGAMVRATESLEAGAGAANIVLESGAQRPAASEEQVVCPEMP